MTVQDYIENNMPFYHISPISNKESILERGIEARRCGAICTVRSDNRTVWDTIIDTQLANANNRFIIIKLLPRIHGISTEDLAPDSVEEQTTPLHTYIVKDVITIRDEDIIEDDYESLHDTNIPEGIIVALEDYVNQPRPDISILNNVNL